MSAFFGLSEVDIYLVKPIVSGRLVKWAEKKSIAFIFRLLGLSWVLWHYFATLFILFYHSLIWKFVSYLIVIFTYRTPTKRWWKERGSWNKVVGNVGLQQNGAVSETAYPGRTWRTFLGHRNVLFRDESSWYTYVTQSSTCSAIWNIIFGRNEDVVSLRITIMEDLITNCIHRLFDNFAIYLWIVNE